MEYKFQHIGRKQGLTAASVNCIEQDQQGFMWFGTNTGAFRYDGNGMKVFMHDKNDTTSIGHNVVYSILEDRNGTLWFGTGDGGLNRFDKSTEQFIRIKQSPGSLSSNVITSLIETSEGKLWAGTANGINRIDTETGKITSFVHDPNYPTSKKPTWISSICEDNVGAIWVATKIGISILNKNTGRFSHFNKEDIHPAHRGLITSIIKDISSSMWIGSDNWLSRFDPKSKKFENFHLDGNVISIFQDSYGTFWVGTSNKLLKFDSKTSRIVGDGDSPENQSGFLNIGVSCMFEDRTGALWFGSRNGVYRLDRDQTLFNQITDNSPEKTRLSYKSVANLGAMKNSHILFTTYQDDSNISIDKFDPVNWRMEPLLSPDQMQTLINNDIRFSREIIEDSFGDIWYMAGRGLLHRYNPKLNRITKFTQDENDASSLRTTGIRMIMEDKDSVIWVVTVNDEISWFDRTHENFKHLNLTTNQTHNGEFNFSILDIAEGKSGRLWIATNVDGIYLFNRKNGTIRRYGHEPGNPNSLSHNYVTSIYEDRNGFLWAAPWHGGLNKLDPESGNVFIYDTKHGLRTNYITGIIEDDNGFIWVTTRNTISRFDPKNERFKNFDEDDGVMNYYFDLNHIAKSKNGFLFFGGSEGVDYINPEEVKENPYVPPIVFTGFTRYNSGKTIKENGVTQKKHFDLSYSDHTLAFEFAALNFRNPHKNQYAYKLEGFNDDWINLGARHEVTFTNLEPGEYILHVKGSNNDGIWNDKGRSISFYISPPWWKTTFAYVSFIVFTLLLLYSLRRYELKRLRLKNEFEKQNFESQKLKELDHVKSHFFANISHEFRTPLTLILGPLDKLLKENFPPAAKQQFRLMKRNTYRLKKLINQLLDLSKIEAGKMKLTASSTDIVKVVGLMVQSFFSMAESKNIALDFHSSEDKIIVYIDRDKFEKIISNLLSNAIKFTPEGGNVEINIIPGDDIVEICVKDTGVGISPDQLTFVFNRFHQVDMSNLRNEDGTGIGLALVKEFVDLHHGEIHVDSEPGKGSAFTVKLKLGKEHLSENEIIVADDSGVSAEIEMQESETYDQIGLSTEKENGEGKSEKPKILVVEDNSDMRSYISDCLQPTYGILHAENGHKGLDQSFDKIPDLVISDVMMPEMDGFEFCTKIKADQRTSHIPVILLTARASGESKMEGLETGADDYLTKPFEVKELQVRVKNLIEQRRRLRERIQKEIILGSDTADLTSTDENFLQKITDIVRNQMSNFEFSVEDFAREAGLSRTQLHRKIHALTGLSSSRFIRTLRLKKAAELLKIEKGNISEIAFEVGFNNLSHFHKSFKEQFGLTPTEYRNEA